MVTVDTGHKAEAKVAAELHKNGFKIIAQNWRRPRCEIDIVAKKSKVIYFVEVKFRASPTQGSGLEHITKRKLDQMKFAAQVWVNENDYGDDYRLVAAEVGASGIKITELDII